MKKITNVLKTYWWIWLILLVASSLFLIFRTPAIQSFLYNLWRLITSFALAIFLLGVIWLFTFGRGQTKSWGVFRILGIIGVSFFSLGLYFFLSEEEKNDLSHMVDNSLFNYLSTGFIFSLLLFVLGEIFLYLDNLQNSIKNIEANNLGKVNTTNSMTCPRCFGKGFVDLDDIKRLGMEQKWGQGFCRYCEGEGEVEKGKTKTQNPLNMDIGLAWHESDIP